MRAQCPLQISSGQKTFDLIFLNFKLFTGGPSVFFAPQHNEILCELF